MEEEAHTRDFSLIVLVGMVDRHLTWRKPIVMANFLFVIIVIPGMRLACPHAKWVRGWGLWEDRFGKRDSQRTQCRLAARLRKRKQ
ncbi:hypothetical protein COLO4_32508 [Corchorus olitorius]|uniref:Uncharacterized protein n=1 Tax=Corchorus olitorius TaxID=93759 RepID=A0A1R3GZF7_9ROSI|nr:hypothetical protein COLO4_32508 [Corchorus olitorius]